jgi:hypothetical protein
MHREKTKLVRRVNRVAKAIERRGIVATYRLHDRVLSNRQARRRYAAHPPALDAVQQGLLDRLRDEGYAMLRLSELVIDPVVVQELEQDGNRFVAETEEELAKEAEGGESALRRREGKEFVVRKYSYGVELGLDDPWLGLGLNRRLLDLANAYLGMWSKLEYVDLWYTPPTGEEERKSSQRWHRDFNDRRLLKAFLYLVDVDEETGPFEYVPRSAPGGELDHLWPWYPLGINYPPQDELAVQVEPRAVTFTAPKGTLILCNTSGFHRGGFATRKPRALATVTYSSPASLASLTVPNYRLPPDRRAEALDPEQRFAVS